MKKSLDALEKKFLEHCQNKKFFRKGDRILLAVSGGMDSMALCELFEKTKQELDLRIGLVHIDHGLRGRESRRDANFVKRFAAAHSIPFYLEKADVRGKASESKMSIEEAARELRYASYENVCRTQGYHKVCTAHHGDDQAETVLMRMIKGAGWSGLSAIRETRENYIRPLLIFSREEIKKYVKKNGIAYVEDRTNKDQKMLRNRIRHDLIPYLERGYDPQVAKHLVQFGKIAEDTRLLLARSAKRLFAKACRRSGGKILLEIKAFNKYLRAQRQAVLELIFSEHFGQNLRFSDYENLMDLAEHRQSGKRLLIGSVEVLKTSGEVVFCRRQDIRERPFSHRIEVDRTYHFDNPGCSFETRKMPFSKELTREFGRNPNVEFIDARKLSGCLVLRSWQAGDRFIPLGMKNFKNLSDFFIDLKLSVPAKKLIPVLYEQKGRKQQVIWVCGYRIDERYKTDHSTHHILKLKCERYEKNDSD